MQSRQLAAPGPFYGKRMWMVEGGTLAVVDGRFNYPEGELLSLFLRAQQTNDRCTSGSLIGGLVRYNP